MKKSGFTLIELLIVIAIIGILAVAFIPSLLGAPSKARDTQRIEVAQKIADFFTLYYVENGDLPDEYSRILTEASAYGVEIIANLSDFGGTFPKDPDPTNCATGAPTCVGAAGYYVFTNFEKMVAAPYPPYSSNPYRFGVTVNVENDENGNADAYYDNTLSDSGNLYNVLVQK